jgi:hypothetical protein
VHDLNESAIFFSSKVAGCVLERPGQFAESGIPAAF